MGLFNHHNNATATNQDQTALNTQANTGTALGGRGPAVGSNQPITHAEADPLYNNERGANQDNMTQGNLAGYHIPGVGLVSPEQAQQIQAVNFQHQGTAGPQATSGAYQDAGMGMGSGHQNNALPQGGMTQGTGVAPGPVDRNLATNHHHNNNNLAGTGAGAGMGAGAGTGGGMQQASLPNATDAKKLDRSGKLDKMIGSITGNQRLKEEGLQKRADAAAVRQQTVHLSEAQRLEQEAQMRRGAAVGMGAHPSHAFAPGSQSVGQGVQPSYGTGTGAPVGGGVGGGAMGGLK